MPRNATRQSTPPSGMMWHTGLNLTSPVSRVDFVGWREWNSVTRSFVGFRVVRCDDRAGDRDTRNVSGTRTLDKEAFVVAEDDDRAMESVEA